MKKKMKYGRSYLLTILLCLTLLSCSDSPTSSDDLYVYQIPEKVNDGWETTSVSDAGMSETTLIMMMNYLSEIPNHEVHSILIIKNNQLVFEEYFGGNVFNWRDPTQRGTYTGFKRDTPHYLASVTKSVTSILFGIAVDQGLINGVDETAESYYPNYTGVFKDGKENITIEHLLTMTEGLAWDESTYPYGNSKNDVTWLFNSADPIKFIFEKPLMSTPGTVFHYNSGNANVLAEIIHKKYNQNIISFTDKYLFGPLGITNYTWQLLRDDYVFASGGLYLMPRDLAKLGYVFLNNGVWNGQQIISQEWIDASTQNHINPEWSNVANGYGYQWWMNTFYTNDKSYNGFFAAGWGDQFLYVFPNENLIIVINCGNYFSTSPISPHFLLQNFILDAIK